MITPKTKGADAIIDAWLIEGVHPPTHQKLKKQLRREWPMLAKAIERLVNAEDSPENASANENREWALKAEKERDEARGQRDMLLEEREQWRLSSVCRELVEQRDMLAAALRIVADGTSCRECGGEDQALIAREALQSLFCDTLQSLTPNAKP